MEAYKCQSKLDMIFHNSLYITALYINSALYITCIVTIGEPARVENVLHAE